MLVLALASASACVKSNSPQCGEALCPAPLVCVRPNECIRPEVLAACADKQENDVCDTPEGVAGICGNGVCIPDTCGDGRVSFGEVCDGAELGDYTCQTFGFYAPEGLACATDCGFDLSGCGGICGDGAANGSELCDGADLGGATCTSLGYYYPEGLGCLDSCFPDVSNCKGKCGDTVADPVEYCDGTIPQGDSCLTFGFGAGELGCSGLCGADLGACHHVRWRTLDTYSGTQLRHVWVGDTGEVVAVGEGASVHLQGSTWIEKRFVTSFDVDAQAVWGLASNDLWAATIYPGGPTGVVMRYNGTQWVGADSPFLSNSRVLYDIWGTSSSNVFAVGTAGTILRWNGTAWTETTVGTDTFLRVLGTAANNVYALSYTELYHFDGSNWTVVTATPAPTSAFTDMWFDATGQLYVARNQQAPARLNGTTWVALPLPSIGSGVSPTPETVVGSLNGTSETLQYDGRASTTVNLPTDRFTRHGTQVYAASQISGRIHVLDGGSMTALPDPAVDVVGGAWVSPTGNLYVAGLGGEIAYHNGTGWSTPAINVGGGARLYAIYGFGDNDLWVGGVAPFGTTTPTLRRCTSSCTTAGSWSNVTLQAGANRVAAIWGRSSSDLYVATDTGQLYRINAGTPTLEKQVTFNPTAIHGSADRVIVVGTGGKIAIRQGGVWTETQTTAATALRGVCVVTNSDIWAVGDGGTVIRFNGTAWSSVTVPTGAGFVGCTAYASNDVLAVANGELWHWNGQTMSPATPPSDLPVTAMAATPRGLFFVYSYSDATNVTDVMHLFKPSSW